MSLAGNIVRDKNRTAGNPLTTLAIGDRPNRDSRSLSPRMSTRVMKSSTCS